MPNLLTLRLGSNSLAGVKSCQTSSFKRNLFEVCAIPEGVMSFFFGNREDKEKTNPLWPWIINGNNEFPVSYNYKSENFEIIGNLYEGIKSDL